MMDSPTENIDLGDMDIFSELDEADREYLQSQEILGFLVNLSEELPEIGNETEETHVPNGNSNQENNHAESGIFNHSPLNEQLTQVGSNEEQTTPFQPPPSKRLRLDVNIQSNYSIRDGIDDHPNQQNEGNGFNQQQQQQQEQHVNSTFPQMFCVNYMSNDLQAELNNHLQQELLYPQPQEEVNNLNSTQPMENAGALNNLLNAITPQHRRNDNHLQTWNDQQNQLNANQQQTWQESDHTVAPFQPIVLQPREDANHQQDNQQPRLEFQFLQDPTTANINLIYHQDLLPPAIDNFEDINNANDQQRRMGMDFPPGVPNENAPGVTPQNVNFETIRGKIINHFFGALRSNMSKGLVQEISSQLQNDTNVLNMLREVNQENLFEVLMNIERMVEEIKKTWVEETETTKRRKRRKETTFLPFTRFDNNGSYHCMVASPEACQFSVTRRTNMERHLITIHGTMSEAELCCGMVFDTKSKYNLHKSLVHPDGLFKCRFPGCSVKPFNRKCILVKHEKVHQGKKNEKRPVAGHSSTENGTDNSNKVNNGEE